MLKQTTMLERLPQINNLPGYPIANRIEQAIRFSHRHATVIRAADDVSRVCNDLNLFSSNHLLLVWGDNHITITSKIFATLWWGNIGRNASKVFSPQTIASLETNANDIQNALETISAETDFTHVKNNLQLLFTDFCRGGIFHIEGVDVSFFTKFFHFWFQTHPLASNPQFLPIICDSYLRQAVYADMVEEGIFTRADIFKIDQFNGIWLRGNLFNSYWEYISYFNRRAVDLDVSPFELEQRCFTDAAKREAAVIVANESGMLFLPPWVSGRYNAKAERAILFNNLLGQTYLFEDDSAKVIGSIIKKEYQKPIAPEQIANQVGFTASDIIDFASELNSEYLVLQRAVSEKEIKRIRKSVVAQKKEFIQQRGGVEQLPSVFSTAEADYNEVLDKQEIPSNVSIELTYGCNERCIHCYNPCSPRQDGIAKLVGQDELVKEDYFKLLDDMTEMGIPKVLFTGGDPFVKKDFLHILRYAHKKKFAISVYTNGQSLANSEKLYNEVLHCYPYNIGLSIYSMDARKHESITRIRGSLAKTKAMAEKLSADGVSLLIKCPIMKQNKEGYKEVRDFAERLNAVPEFEVNITAGVDGDTYASDTLLLSEDEMQRVLKDPLMPLSPFRDALNRFMPRTPEMLFCGAGRNNANINPTGDMSPCMAFPLKCGSVRERSFIDIWHNSSELKRIRSLHYGLSNQCGKESYCKFCNRCIGQSFVEHGVPENKSTHNCYLARIRENLYKEKDKSIS